MRSVIVAVLAVAVASACNENPVASSDIFGETWELASLQRNGSDVVVVQEPSKYTLRLENDARASVKSDCNSCGGSYSIDGSTLKVGPIACTRVACAEGSLDPEYPRTLEGSKTVLLNDSELVIRGDGVTLRFRH